MGMVARMKINATYTVNVVDEHKLQPIVAILEGRGYEVSVKAGSQVAVLVTNAPVYVLHKARTANHETKLLGLWAFKNLSPDAHTVRGPICLEDAKEITK